MEDWMWGIPAVFTMVLAVCVTAISPTHEEAMEHPRRLGDAFALAAVAAILSLTAWVIYFSLA